MSRVSNSQATSFGNELRRLRHMLLLASVLASTAGVVLLSLLVLGVDQQARAANVDAELSRRATAGRSLLYFIVGHLQVDGLVDDEATVGYPQVFVVERTGRIAFDHRERQFDVDLVALSEQAIETGESEVGDTITSDGEPVRYWAEPFYYDESPRVVAGAVVVTGDPNATDEGRDTLMVAVWGGAAALIALLGAGSWFLIRRSLAPATRALAEKERFVADAAHELRRPLTAIRTTAEHGLGGGETRDALQRTVWLTDSAADMLSNLLTLARLDARGSKLVGAKLRLDQLVEVAAESRPGVHVWLGEPSIVTGDSVLLNQAIGNLLDNALNHGAAPVDVAVKGGRVVVVDSGPGFAPGQHKTIFDRYHSTDQRRGTGLGMALVAAVARVHGGGVTAENQPGRGARVTFYVG